jgi:hypothetical protein
MVWEDGENVPLRLKPRMAVSFCGTAEAVPFLQDRVLTQTLMLAAARRPKALWGSQQGGRSQFICTERSGGLENPFPPD